MKFLTRLLALLVAAAIPPLSPALGQGGVPGAPAQPGPMWAPNWYKGYVPTPYEWQLMWSNKLSYFAGGLPVAYGGTGATTATQALANLGGMSNVLSQGAIFIGNTSNIAQQRILSGACSLNSTGTLTCPTFTSTVNGQVPASGGGTTNFLRADGTWAMPVGTVTSVGLSGGTTGLTVSGTPVVGSGTMTLAGTLAAANGGTGVNNGSNTITLGGNLNLAGGLTTVGAFSSTFTMSGAYNYTFPGLTTPLLGLSGALTTNDILVASADGRAIDSNLQLVTSLPAGNVMCNPTNASAVPQMCGALGMPNGTAALPSLSFYNDLTSGLYLDSVNIMGLSVGGVELVKMHKPSGTTYVDIAATGSAIVRAASTSAGNATLIVSGTGSSGVDLEYNSATADGAVTPYVGRFFGNGIGTTNNYITFTAAATGNGVRIGAAGSSDTNININVQPPGSGLFQYNGNTVLYSGGALGTPTSGTATNLTGLPISSGVSGLGTSVATALGVNVGTAGAFVVNGGALGTPSSGTATNLTGLPISTGVSGLGTNVATALGVNVGTAGAFVTNGGALGTPSSGTATNITGLPAGTGLTGQVLVANGGTNATSGQVAASNLSLNYVQCHTSTDSSVTGTVSATILGWCNIAAGVMTTNSCLVIDSNYQFAAGGSPANWVQQVRIVAGTSNGTIGGTSLASFTMTQPNGGRFPWKICNSNSLSAQWMQGQTPFGAVSTAPATSTINTANAWTISLNATPGNTGDTIHLLGHTESLTQTAGN